MTITLIIIGNLTDETENVKQNKNGSQRKFG